MSLLREVQYTRLLQETKEVLESCLECIWEDLSRMKEQEVCRDEDQQVIEETSEKISNLMKKIKGC